MQSSADTPRTLGGLLAAAADRWPARTAVEQDGVRLDFADLHRQTERAAARLAAAGAGPAVLLFDNTPDCVVAFLAAARAGVRLVPAEPDATLTQLEGLATEAEAPVLIGRSERLIALDAAGRWRGPVMETDGLPQVGPAGRPAPPEPDGNAPFLHQFSSGSTGAPKAAVHTQHNLVRGSLIYRASFGYGPEDTVLAAVPLLHSFGMVAGLVTSLLTGARLVVLGRFTPGRLLGELRRTGATVLVATPLACDLLVRSAGAAAPAGPLALRLCLSSGAALQPATAERFADRFGTGISEVYGCTEAGIIASRQPESDAAPAPAGEVGRPAPGVEVRLVDKADADVAPGDEGLLLVRTPAMFLGYLDRPGATAEVLREGWYRTGDLARLDDAGRLHLIGREDTFVNVGGKKVNPTQVEQVLLGHPLLAEAVVWGEDLPEGGQRVRATVVATGPLTAAELGAWCREWLQPYQVPGGVEFVAALPKSSSGKIRRAEVAAAGVRSRTRHQGERRP
ncbi:acyl--CoA ligase [Streptomyces sp. JJ66]|uniref:class I adenylate-forming enzyme family protein n=1 Tax=Streptomyces sp. JJ66 TaxID=2803843 RepID=UPI001C59DEED|nr:class I adenylate-forming enzyme family protein [Streptomyces sp. JJ66]MBW1600734.1 acyl--CoA ligase [Streptomyces sp. JJ66]